jgi:hypothetical protein
MCSENPGFVCSSRMSAQAGASADLSAEASVKAEALAKAGMNEMSDKFNAMG